MAIASLLNLFHPEIVVIGGGFGAAAGEQLLEAARPVIRHEALAPAATTSRSRLPSSVRPPG